MIAFAELVDRLAVTPSRRAKITLLRHYFATTPDPQRGHALAAIAGGLPILNVRPAALRQLAAERTDPVLFALSQDFVGDLTETLALIWPAAPTNAPPPTLADLVDTLGNAPKADHLAIVARLLDAAAPAARLTLLKLATGGLRIGASPRLARLALADLAPGVTADAIEEIWHSLAPPYAPLFAWLEGRGPKPDPADAPVFRPLMPAHPLEAADIARLDLAPLRAASTWDGLRVQLVATAGGRRLYSHEAEDISAAFPELLAAMDFRGVLDGELLVLREGAVASPADLQQRLTRKRASPKLQAQFPAWVRLHDLLFEDETDLRPLDFDTRRARLEAFHARVQPARMDLAPLHPATAIDDLHALRNAAGVEGLMLKRGDSPYLPGHPPGMWWTWKRDPLTLDAVLMYAQRGAGPLSRPYAEYTVGVRRADGALVPVGKPVSGLTAPDQQHLDTWIREHTVAKFGPVREVEPALVLEIAFDAAHRSTRHKSGVVLRGPRIVRLRPDTPAAEAARLETLLRLAGGD